MEETLNDCLYHVSVGHGESKCVFVRGATLQCGQEERNLE